MLDATATDQQYEGSYAGGASRRPGMLFLLDIVQLPCPVPFDLTSRILWNFPQKKCAKKKELK
jgi:hypothetical protein